MRAPPWPNLDADYVYLAPQVSEINLDTGLPFTAAHIAALELLVKVAS